jgi:hypothetical protein
MAVMARGNAEGHYSRPRPLLISRACNRANMKKAICMLMLLLINFNREYSVATFDEQKQ